MELPVKIEPITNAVMVQIVGDRPVVSLMIRDADQRERLEGLAHEILQLLAARNSSL